MEEKIKKERKMVLFGVLLILLSGIAGFMVHAGSNGNEKQELSNKLMQYYKNTLMPAYEAGFMTRLITNLNNFALDCISGDVKLYSWENINGSKNGILFFCDATNKTYPLKYPDAEKYK